MEISKFKNPSGKIESFERGEYHAFTPKFLPPEISYDSIADLLEEASKLLGVLSGTTRYLPNSDLLIRPIVSREAILSSKIEGTQSSIDDLFEYEAKSDNSDTPKRKHDIVEVINCMRALREGISDVKNSTVSIDVIKKLHKILMQDDVKNKDNAGKIRTKQSYIGRDGTPIAQARYVPPPPERLEPLLSNLDDFIRNKPDNTPVLVWVALAHYQFESIHPFSDGNGRIGRILLLLMLLHSRELSLPVLNISEYFEKNRKQYYDHMLMVSQENRWIEWINFFLQGVIEQCREAETTITGILSLKKEFDEVIASTKPSGSVMRLLNYLFSQPIITIPKAAKYLGVAYPSAQGAINHLEDLGILVKINTDKRNKMYQSPRIIEAFE